jgi:6-phosphogluconate dehydrogenase
VKMVHNGIEYGDMQLIAEAYDLMRNILGLKPEELANVFEEWNRGPLSSFLIEITAKIFRKKDEDGAGYLVDKILDRAGQKGTGAWTAQSALDLGVSIPTLAAAVDSRNISALKDERVKASVELPAPKRTDFTGDKKEFIQAVHDALFCSKVMAYAQGMRLLAVASNEYKWDLKLGEIASIWRAGCIIRAVFLGEIKRAYDANPKLTNLILDPGLKKELVSRIDRLRTVLSVTTALGVPAPAFSASLAYYDAYRTAELPLNLTQAQRDFFGAHTYERKDKDGVFHTQWEG